MAAIIEPIYKTRFGAFYHHALIYHGLFARMLQSQLYCLNARLKQREIVPRKQVCWDFELLIFVLFVVP